MRFCRRLLSQIVIINNSRFSHGPIKKRALKKKKKQKNRRAVLYKRFVLTSRTFTKKKKKNGAQLLYYLGGRGRVRAILVAMLLKSAGTIMYFVYQ